MPPLQHLLIPLYCRVGTALESIHLSRNLSGCPIFPLRTSKHHHNSRSHSPYNQLRLNPIVLVGAASSQRRFKEMPIAQKTEIPPTVQGTFNTGI